MASAVYIEKILKDEPEVLWNSASGTTVTDLSGNGNHGKLYKDQAISAAGHTAVRGGVSGGQQVLKNNSSWTGGPPVTTQTMPGTGIRADDFKPYVSGAQVSLECWCYKIDPWSFATMFSADTGSGGAANAPHPTLEWGSLASTYPYGKQFARWYAKVNTFPTGWMDWGTDNTGNPQCDFRMFKWHHIVLTVNDNNGDTELFIDSVSQGVQDTGYGGGTPHFETVTNPGNFQVGWRGGPTLFADPGNTEVWGGVLAYIATYPYILSDGQIRNHYEAGTKVKRSKKLRLLDLSNPEESINLSFGSLQNWTKERIT